MPFRSATALFMKLGDHVGDQRAPTRLVRGTKSSPILAIEIFKEEDVVLEVRISLHLLIVSEDRPSTMLIAPEDTCQPAPQLISNLFQRQLSSGADRALYLKALAEEAVVLAQALDEQVVDG